MRALEREAKAQRDLLESYLAKYREATTRENIDAAPTDGRIISRAIVSNTPAYPKKLPIVLIATLATLMLTAGCIVTGELLRMTAPRGAAPMPRQARVTEPVFKPFVRTCRAGAAGRRRACRSCRPSERSVAVPSLPLRARRHPELAAGVTEIEQLAQDLRAAGTPRARSRSSAPATTTTSR